MVSGVNLNASQLQEPELTSTRGIKINKNIYRLHEPDLSTVKGGLAEPGPDPGQIM